MRDEIFDPFDQKKRAEEDLPPAPTWQAVNSMWNRGSGQAPPTDYGDRALLWRGEMNQAIVDGDYARANQLRDRISRLDEATGHTVIDRAAGIAEGALLNYGKFLPELGGSLIEGMGHLNTWMENKENVAEIARREEANTIYQQWLDTGLKMNGDLLTDRERYIAESVIRQNDYMIESLPTMTREQEARTMDSANQFYGIADDWDDSADRAIARAKEGLDPISSAGVDLTVAGAQLAADAGLTALTGGTILPFKVIQALGDGVQDARRGGADYGDQFVYGAGKAALKTFTEKFSNVTKLAEKSWGKGAAEKILKPVIGDFVDTSGGQKIFSFGGEFAGNFLESTLTPLLQQLTYDKTAPWRLRGSLYQALIDAAAKTLSGIADGSFE